MATVFDVAKYILNKLGEMDTWKLQKLVYYCQAWSAAWEDRGIFDSRIEAWANGPVCPELFKQHQGTYRTSPDAFYPRYKFAPDSLSPDDVDTIEAVIKSYGDKPGYWLRALTHMEDPWRKARGDIPEMEPCTNEITLESMAEYYGSL
ncbi:MAG: DUF4065 domain-containing protein [Oscillospiraceae bacterium]|nr:DUF4065 domain-containing protein [Oscillospiraceae bacterium]